MGQTQTQRASMTYFSDEIEAVMESEVEILKKMSIELTQDALSKMRTITPKTDFKKLAVTAMAAKS